MLALRHGALLLPALLMIASSCGPSAAEADFRSSSGNAKLDAITESARRDDHADVIRLVEQLDSVDPAVRMAAEVRLEQLTGKTFGYQHFDSLQERRAAIRQWAESVEGEAQDG